MSCQLKLKLAASIGCTNSRVVGARSEQSKMNKTLGGVVMMEMGFVMRQERTLTGSIFKQTEEFLEEVGYGILKNIQTERGMDEYRSVLDFFFCELHPEFQESCFLFYEDEGPQLREIISLEQAREYDDEMMVAIDMLWAFNIAA